MSERIDKALLLITAPLETIYQAFVKEEAFKTWFTPHDMTSEIESFDATEGGKFIVDLKYDDEEMAAKKAENVGWFTGTFKVLDPYHRIVFTIEFNADSEKYKDVMEQDWVLVDQDRGTEVSVECRNVPDDIGKEHHERALMVNLYQLADYVAETK